MQRVKEVKNEKSDVSIFLEKGQSSIVVVEDEPRILFFGVEDGDLYRFLAPDKIGFVR